MNNEADWYMELIRPEFAPPSWIFGPVWSVLYAIIAISFTFVFIQVVRGTFPSWVAVPFALNLLFNFAFNPIQFGLQSNVLAAIDIILVLTTIVWAGRVIYPLAPWVLYVNIPYFLWVSFATILQLTITYLNW